jgi:uncharacterized NAD(P)/FAD-binding protein YdhS
MKKMTPFKRFLNGVEAAQMDFNEVMDELRAFAEIMSQKQNTLELDEDGYFYVTAAGPIEIIIPVVEKHLEKLKRIAAERAK